MQDESRHFFVVDVRTNKTYLIRSEESEEIVSVVSLLNSGRKLKAD